MKKLSAVIVILLFPFISGMHIKSVSEEPLKFTDSNFEEEVLKSEMPVLVDFWASWCGPCKMIAPSIKELAGEYEGKIKIGKLDVDENANTASKYEITSIPALLIFKNGKVVDKIIGAVPKSKISKKLEKYAD